jgi:xylulokinase
MEGITFSLMNILEVIEGFGIHVESLRFTNQAASSTFWRQMIADVTGKPVLYTDVPQASSFGIMMLALVNQGYYKDIKEACKKLINIKVKQEPNQELHQKYLEYYNLYKKLYHDLKRNFQSLQKI